MFRFDAGFTIGGGHAIRCLALAQALRGEGWVCQIVTTATGMQTLKDFTTFGCQITTVPENTARDAKILIAIKPDGCDLLVVDHYKWSATQEHACRNWAKRILVIDDLCNRPHDCDFLLDPAINCSPAQYAPLVKSGCRLLLNPGYALLRSEFAAYRLAHPARSFIALERIFLNFGLLDTANLTEQALIALEQAGFRGTVDIAMGSMSPHLPRIRERIKDSFLRATVHVNPINLIDLMAETDLIIGAGGGGAWERCCLGLPSLMVVAAENQLHNAHTLADYGACNWLPANDVNALVLHIATLREDPDRLTHMANAARSLTDGLGARRTAIAIAPETTRRGDLVNLRRGNIADAELLLQWQSHPGTRRYARNPQVPNPAEHQAWLRQKLQDPGCILNIVVCNERPVATLRLDRVQKSAQRDTFEISIYVDPEQTGKGFGQATLAMARRLLPQATFLAHVHADNKASHNLFQTAGYRMENDVYINYPNTSIFVTHVEHH